MTRVIPPAQAVRFWDRIAPKYAAKPVSDPAAYEAKLARLRALVRPTDRVLEIGCGTGSTALRLSAWAGEVTATDLSGAMIAIAEDKRAAAGADRVVFHQAAAEEIVAGGPFDMVAAFSLLHLVEDLPATLRAAFVQTRPGGLFVSKTVCLGDGPWWMRGFVRVLRLVGIAPPVQMVRHSDLRAALQDAGFTLLDSRYFGKGRLNPFVVAQRPG